MITEIKDQILKISNWIQSQDIKEIDGFTLSAAATKLAVLRVNLGQELAQALGDYDLSYINRKIQYAHAWGRTKTKLEEIAKKATVQDVENAVIIELEGAHKKEIQDKIYADSLKLLYDSSGTLITTIQTRIKQLEREKAESILT